MGHKPSENTDIGFYRQQEHNPKVGKKTVLYWVNQ